MMLSVGARRKRDGPGFFRRAVCVLMLGGMLHGCADANVPGARPIDIPAPTSADTRKRAVNEKPDSVVYLPLGEDVLQPRTLSNDALPKDQVGPLELRGETLGGALQLILADYDIPLAFQSNEGLTRTVTVANLHGPMDKVIEHVCGLADLYCAYEGGMLTVKDTQTFTVSIPPVTSGDSDIIDAVATGLAAITSTQPIVDKGTRTIVYTATHRTAEMAERYFQRMRSNTALIIFETYIWEVSLNAQNSTGIDWSHIQDIGKFKTGISFSGAATAELTPISIGLPTMGNVDFGANNILEFISDYGAVKTISQPQIAVLSGAKASLRVADTVNYVSSLERTVDNGEVSVSTQTDSVDTGFTMTIASAWDNATVYGTIEINLQEFRGFKDFDADGTTLQLPETTERELKTQVRIRPGDSLLIAGLVRENDSYSTNGPGFMKPILATSRDVAARNVELVFLLRPRIVAYTTKDTGAPAQVPGSSSEGGRSFSSLYKAGRAGNSVSAADGKTAALSLTAPESSDAQVSSDPAPVPAVQSPAAPSMPAVPVRAVASSAEIEEFHPEAIEPAAGAMPPSSALLPPPEPLSASSEESAGVTEMAPPLLPLPPGDDAMESSAPAIHPANLMTRPSAPSPEISSGKEVPVLTPVAESAAEVSGAAPVLSGPVSLTRAPVAPLPSSNTLIPPAPVSPGGYDYAPEYKKYYPDIDSMNPYMKKVTGP